MPPSNGALLTPRPRPAQIEDPSTSLPTIARRPWALIIVVLLIDIGLAVAGGVLLSMGLDSAPSAGPPAPKAGADTTPPSPAVRAVEVTPVEVTPADPRVLATDGVQASDPATRGSAAPRPGAAGSAATAKAAAGSAGTAKAAGSASVQAATGAGSATGSAATAKAATGSAAAGSASASSAAGSAGSGDPGAGKQPRRPRPPPAAGKGPIDPYDTHASDPLPAETK